MNFDSKNEDFPHEFIVNFNYLPLSIYINYDYNLPPKVPPKVLIQLLLR